MPSGIEQLPMPLGLSQLTLPDYVQYLDPRSPNSKRQMSPTHRYNIYLAIEQSKISPTHSLRSNRKIVPRLPQNTLFKQLIIEHFWGRTPRPPLQKDSMILYLWALATRHLTPQDYLFKILWHPMWFCCLQLCQGPSQCVMTINVSRRSRVIMHPCTHYANVSLLPILRTWSLWRCTKFYCTDEYLIFYKSPQIYDLIWQMSLWNVYPKRNN